MVTQHYPSLSYRQPLAGICQLCGQEQDTEAERNRKCVCVCTFLHICIYIYIVIAFELLALWWCSKDFKVLFRNILH